MLEALACILERDLLTVERELALYPTDESLWVLAPGLANSGGTLALHLIGNLRHFIGAVLGGSSYVRTREVEFATRSGTREALILQVQTTRREVADALASLAPSRLDEPFPLVVGDVRPLTRSFLLHLVAHLGFHLGQLDYHRRATTGNSASASPMSPSALLPTFTP